MNNKLIIVSLLFFSACGKRSSDTISANNPRDTTEQILGDSSVVRKRNYENTKIHREFDNDSLILDLPDLKTLVKSFTSKPKVKEKKYGDRDYYGKYRVYADNLDTLVIDKGDGAENGFRNEIYFVKNDSLVLYRKYSLIPDSGRYELVTEQLVTFRNGLVIFKQRQMRTKDWSKLNFGDMKFTIIYEEPIKYHQKAFKGNLKRLYKLELIE